MFKKKAGRARSVSAVPTNTPRRISGVQRSRSMPSNIRRRHVKGIMKYVTADDSLHSTYGTTTEDDGKEGEGSDSHIRAGNIQFKQIEIREYARTIGDNPSCSSGPPVSISWDYDPETKIVSVEEYEECRPPRRTHFEMVLPRDVRQQMLRKEWDVTQAQIAAAVRANIKAKNQRRATVNNLGKATKMEEFMESAGKKMKRGLFLQKSTSKQVKELESQLAAADRARAQAMLDSQMADEYKEEFKAAVIITAEEEEVSEEDLDPVASSEPIAETRKAPTEMKNGVKDHQEEKKVDEDKSELRVAAKDDKKDVHSAAHLGSPAPKENSSDNLLLI